MIRNLLFAAVFFSFLLTLAALGFLLVVLYPTTHLARYLGTAEWTFAITWTLFTITSAVDLLVAHYRNRQLTQKCGELKEKIRA